MHIGEWLEGLAEEEKIKQASAQLEQTFDKMDPADLLEIASGTASVDGVLEKMAAGESWLESKMKNPLSPPWSKERMGMMKERLSKIDAGQDKEKIRKTVKDMKKNPKKYMLGPAGRRTKTAEVALPFMDQVARFVAHSHYEVEKQAQEGEMTSFSAFTSPEAQAKAKAMRTAVKATKGAPTQVRKAAVQKAGKSLSKMAKAEMDWKTPAGIAAGTATLGGAGYLALRKGRGKKLLQAARGMFGKGSKEVAKTEVKTPISKIPRAKKTRPKYHGRSVEEIAQAPTPKAAPKPRSQPSAAEITSQAKKTNQAEAQKKRVEALRKEVLFGEAPWTKRSSAGFVHLVRMLSGDLGYGY